MGRLQSATYVALLYDVLSSGKISKDTISIVARSLEKRWWLSHSKAIEFPNPT